MRITGVGVDYAFDGWGETLEVQASCVHALKKNGTAAFIGRGTLGPKNIKL
jgi:hypothetical protein